MSYNKFDVCSNGLVLLGADPISSFTGSPAAETCSVRYPMLRDSLLASYPWNFTIKKVELTRDVATPTSTYDYQYTIPEDSLNDGALVVYSDEDTELPFLDYVSQGGKILTDETRLWADYQYRPDEADWPQYFYNLVAHAVAADLAWSITKDRNQQIFWTEKAYGTPSANGVGGLIRTARVLDSYVSPPNNRMHHFPLVAARRGGGPHPWRPAT